MMNEQGLEIALRKILPVEQHNDVSEIALLLTDVIKNAQNHREYQLDAASQPHLERILKGLAGQKAEIDKTVVSFGANNQSGDIVIRDVAGGNIVTLTINNHNSSNTLQIRVFQIIMIFAILIFLVMIILPSLMGFENFGEMLRSWQAYTRIPRPYTPLRPVP